MTKQEARQILASWLESSKGTEEQLGYIEGWFDKKDEEAFCMAIEALKSERPKGKWVYVQCKSVPSIGSWECSVCHHVCKTGQKPRFNYCSNCGADMRGNKE